VALASPDDDTPLFCSDANTRTTYYIFRVEHRVLFVVIYVAKPNMKANQPEVIEFAKEVLEFLRYCALLRKSSPQLSSPENSSSSSSSSTAPVGDSQ